MNPCANCHTERFQKRIRGYCPRCYRLVRKLEVVQAWDFNDPSTLRDYPANSIFRTLKDFKILKEGYTHQLSSRLVSTRCREEKLTGDVNGITIEYMLRNLAKRAGARREVHYGIAGWIDHAFTPDQKRDLYRILYDIEEAIPQSVLSTSKAYQEFGG